MELIYLYIEKFNGILKKKEINFSPNFHVEIINKRLVIENKRSYMNKLYPSSIKNITMLLGKNGSGKTTILDILGMNRDDRCDQSIKRKGRSRSEVIDSYFILYHIQGDYFGIEIMDDIESNDKITKLFKNNLTNFNFYKTNNPFYKIPIGLVIKKNNDIFEVVDHFFNEYSPLGHSISGKVGVNYVSNKYSERIDIRYNYIGKNEENYERDGYLCKRRYYLKATNEMKYTYINHLNNSKELHFCADSSAIEIEPDFDYRLGVGMKYEEMESWISNLEKILYIDNSDRVDSLKLFQNDEEIEKIRVVNNKKKYKEIFLLDTLSSYIIQQFIKGICEIINDSLPLSDAKETVNINLFDDEHIKFLNNFKKNEYKQSNSKFILGSLLDKKKEYENLIKVIHYYKEDKSLKNYDKLICVSRYLYSRMESSVELKSDSRYQIAIEDFLNALSSLEGCYFNKKNISIKCDSEIDEMVVKALRTYDKYMLNQYNDIQVRFKIKTLNLSEGENNFLNLLSKIFDIVEESKEDQLLIILLDEPDQSLHPEWSRRFINVLCNEMEKYKNKNIQIVLSTHSPFMATDIMSEHIYCLENDYDEEKKGRINIYSMTQKSNSIHNTFGANIYEILKDSFILEKTIGAFSYNKIVNLITELKNQSDSCNIEYEKFLIDSIGELPLRKKLEDMYREKRGNCHRLKNDLVKQIKLEIDEEKLNKIKEILEGD